MIINIAFKEEQSKENMLLERIKDKKINNDKNDVLVSGIDEIKISLAKCCSPIKGDEIIGYISKGNGIIVHNKECKNIKESERTIDVSWNKKVNHKFQAKLSLITDVKDNILYDIITCSSTNNISINSITNKVRNYECFVDLKIEVNDTEELKKYILILERLDYVKSVNRVFE